MKIGLFSECHYGITSGNIIEAMLHNLRDLQPDVVVNCGDDSGGFMGYTGVRFVAEACRKIIGDSIPILHVMGNHDYWCGHGGNAWAKNLRMVRKLLSDNNIYSLDQAPVYGLDDVLFIGNSGWYTHPNPPTNDRNFMPKTHYRADMNMRILESKTRQIRDVLRDNRTLKQQFRVHVFVSHFPIIRGDGVDWKGRFEDFSWDDAALRQELTDFGITHFLCGHSHSYHNGPQRFESGSDYYKPNCILIDI